MDRRRPKRKTRMTEDRKRARDTIIERHGPDFWQKIGDKSAGFRDPRVAQLAALKRWHPEWFDENGELITPETAEANNGGH